MTETVEILVGVIGRAHGIRGEVAVEPRTDEPARRFAAGARLRAEETGRIFVVESSRDHSGRLLVNFDGLTDRTQAESVRGIRLLTDVPADEAPEGAGEFYDRQLVGLLAYTTDGVEIGPVTTVLHMPGQDVLELKTTHGVRLVPFVEALVPEVDLGAGRLTVATVEGLLEDEGDPA